MTPFQWLTLCCLAGALLWELTRIASGSGLWRIALVRSAVWIVAGISIARPHLLQSLANRIGIHRGADLVTYFLALAFLATAFLFYARYVRLQRQVVELVRELAILEAKRAGGTGPGAESPPGRDV